MRLQRNEFQRIVERALEEIPPLFQDALENVDIQVRWAPTPDERRRIRLRAGHDLLGLYLGIPLTQRSHYHTLVLPDTIVVYQRAHERHCRTEEEMVEQVRQTVLHEIGHYMGIGEDRLRELGVG